MITDHILANDISIEAMMWLAMQGGAFEWLAEEPDLYSPEDGKPAQWPPNAANTKQARIAPTDELRPADTFIRWS